MSSPPPRGLLLFAALVAGVYLLSPPRAWRDIHTLSNVPERALVEQVVGGCNWPGGCPPPPTASAGDTDGLQHSPPPPPPPLSAAMEGCDANGECTVEALVRRHAVDNTVVVTFGNAKQAIFTENWVYHLRRLGVGGLLVGMMNQRSTEARYVHFAAKLRAIGVGVYTVNSPEVLRQPQGGRWFHVLPLLATGARVLLSDSDVAWLRDPLPYFRQLEAAHPALDFTVSSDAQGGSDGRRLPQLPSSLVSGSVAGGHESAVEAEAVWSGGRRQRRRAARLARVGPTGWRGARRGRDGGGGGGDGGGDGGERVSDRGQDGDLDVEAFGHCGGPSLNIGIMHFPPGRRPGTLLAMQEAVAHLSSEGNLGRVDQGPINFRWRFGAGKAGMAGYFRWRHPLHPVRDATGARLCGFCNGSSVGGVLPSAQFCNTLTHSVLQLWKQREVRPYAVHATWMRQQRMEFKLMRLREQTLWRDPPTWYGAPLAPPPQCMAGAATPHADSEGCAASAGGGVGPTVPAAGFVIYTPQLRREWLTVPPLADGGIPTHHLSLIWEQLRQLRSAFFLARALGRALILPAVTCTCEMGFFIHHIKGDCRAPDHPTLHLPYNCSIDHYLDPVALHTSPFAHRETSFLDNPRTPHDLRRTSTARVRVCPPTNAATPPATDDPCHPARPLIDGEVRLPAGERVQHLRGRLAHVKAKLLHVDDVLGAFGGFDEDTTAGRDELVQYHDDLQQLLASWCCTADERFKRLAGVIPYVLPPLEGQSAWRGAPKLQWAAQAMAEIFEAAGDADRARAVRPPA